MGPQIAPNGVTCMKAHASKAGSNTCSFDLQQNSILIKAVWNFMVLTNEVICHMGLLHCPRPLRRGNLHDNILDCTLAPKR